MCLKNIDVSLIDVIIFVVLIVVAMVIDDIVIIIEVVIGVVLLLVGRTTTLLEACHGLAGIDYFTVVGMVMQMHKREADCFMRTGHLS